MKRKAFASELHLTFRQLEPRRVLSVNSAFAAGALTINIVDDGANTNAALLVNGASFFADADGNQIFNAGETTGLLTSLQQVTVNGAAGVGSFAWRGDFSTSNALQNLLVQNVSSATLDANAVLQNSATVSADASITFGSNSNLTINNDLTANATAVNGTISNSPSASLHVLDAASLGANGINLGLAAGDNVQFGTLTLTSTGSVQIAEDTNGGDLNPGTRFIGANTVGSIGLTSDSTIQFDAGSSFAANTSIGFQANGINSDIQINGIIQSANGSVNLQSTDSILFGSAGSVNVSNAGNVVLTANSDSLDGNGSDGITMSDGSSIQVAGGTIRLSAENAFGGDIRFGQLTANTNVGTAIDVRTLGSILDGTVAETANLSATSGAISLLATNGAIGAGAAAADIDFNAIRLTFNALGIVQLTDLAGGIAVTGASSAGGGGFLAANSPLTISANVNVGASMVFTAGNSALPGDNLTIDTAAIVTLNSAVAGTLTFEAGDDIVFNTGRIVTTGGGIHSVVLSADLDNAGLGAADGDRGSISQDGSAIVEVTTDNLTANAATGINIDTTVTNLTANNTVSGGIVIRETNGINLTSIVSAGGTIDVTAAGLVTATSVTASGAGSNATITTTTGGIAVTNVTAANNVVLTATAGDITSGNITGTAGSVGITATNGDVTIGSITAGTTVIIATPLGSINDAQNDAIADISAGGLINLTARDEIAGLAADGRLDLAAGSNVSAISNVGNILLRGLGALTLTNVTTLAGFIDVLAQGTITANNVDSTGTDTNLNDITLQSLAGDVRVGLVQAGPALGDVTITAQNNIVDNDTGADNLDIRGNDITLTATTGSIGSNSNEVFRENVNAIEIIATGNLIANAPAGLVATDATVTGTTTITAISGWIQSNGDINVVGQVFTVTNLALIADADNNGVGTLFLDNSLTIVGDLRVEGADIVAADGSIDLIANRLMVYSGQSETLNITTPQFDATTNGNLIVSANGSIELIDLSVPFQVDHNPVIPPVDRDNIALQTLSNSGFIQLDATGSITVSDDVIAGNDLIQTSTGTITLRANALGGSVNIKDTILSDAGAIVIEAFQDINFGGAISPNEAADTDNFSIVTTTTGNITLRADSDGTLSGAGGAITMADGTRVIAGRDTSALYIPGLNGNPSPSSFSLDAAAQSAGFAEIRLFADESIALGSLQSANVDAIAILVQSFNGAITDSTAAETSNLVTPGTATLRAVLGIGAAAAADIDTTIGTLLATNSTSGNIFVQETNGLIIGGTGVRTLAGNGNINVDVDAGNLTVNSVVTANGSGTVTLNADAGTINLNAAVSSTTGAIVMTGDAVNQNTGGNISTGVAGTVAVTADNGNITMADGTTTSTTNGVINYSATGNVALSQLISTDAAINVTADSDANGAGAITDNSVAETPNLSTIGTATLVAAQGIGAAGINNINTTIGTLVATNSTTGNIFVQETNGLIIGGTGVRTLGGNGNINVDVDAGNLTVNSVATDNGTGTVTLNADAGTVFLNAAVSSTTGSITVTGDVVNQNAGGNIATGGTGTATVIADNGNITMADGTTTTTASGAINYSATGNVALSQLISTDAAINVTADSDANGTGAITDNTAAEAFNLITTGTATLSASQGIGAAGASDIDTTIGTLVATNSTSGDIFVQETNGLIIGGTGVRTLGGNGNINVDVDAGNLTANSVVTANGVGSVTLNADAGTVTLAATVSSSTGAVLVTGDAINQNAGGNIATSGAGTVTATADNGNITMADGTTTTTTNGIINYSATGNVALSQLISTDAAINVTADSDANGTGAITDNSVAETPNLSTIGTATLLAAQGIGAAGAADIDTTIGTLVATNSTTGDIFVQETNGLIIGGPGVRTLGGNGNINVDVVAGNLALNSVVAANGTGNVTLISRIGWIDEGSAAVVVQGNVLTIVAGQYAHLHNTQVNQLDASVGSNAILNAAFGQVVNANASNRGDDFLDNLLINVPGTQLVGDANPSEFQFASKYSNGYSLFIVNQTALVVNRATAGIVTLSSSPNIYIETRNATNLTIAGDVITRSTTANEGGIVLVAGKDFFLLPSGKLETQVVTGSAFRQTIENIGPGDQYLGAKFYDGGEGSDPNMRSTRNVIQESSRLAETSVRHVNQRVAMQFGFAGEQGFIAIVGYADGGAVGGSNPRAFNVTGEQGALPTNPADQTSLLSYPATNPTIAVFTRPNEFTQQFLNENQVLPTNAIVRRSSDFFVFANASAPIVAEIRDLTFQFAPIKSVTSEGSAGGSFLPADLPQIKVPVPGTFSLPTEIANPIVIRPPEVEFAITVDKSKIVSIYRVEYVDTNSDGQPGMDELPSESSVLESIKKPQVKDDGFEITSASDGTPTQQEIDAKKAELIQDPQRPSGAYAIVEKDPDGKESVIEVFPIRDWEDEAPKSSTELPIVPSNEKPLDEPEAEDMIIPRPRPKDSSSYFAPPGQDNEQPGVATMDSAPIDSDVAALRGNSRFVSLGLFFGSLWIVRESTKTETTSTNEVLEELGSIGFSSRDRRNRRLRSKLNK